MGNMFYEIIRNGEKIQAGYGVETVCEQPACGARISRGLDYLCGQTPGGDEHGCGGYFCADHLYMGPAKETGDLCGECLPAARVALESQPAG